MILRQSTAVQFMMGPFLDPAAQTTEEGLTIGAAEVFVSKNGASYDAKNEGTAMVHDQTGMYLCKLDTTDTSTVGSLSILVDDTADLATPVEVTHQVVEEAIYDALYVASADGFNSAGEVSLKAATQVTLDAILSDTGEMQADLANGGRIDLLIDSIIAEVVTAQSLPSQGAIPLTATLAEATMWNLKFLRNIKKQTATQFSLLNHTDDTTVDTKATISDDGTTLTYGKMVTGP